MRKLLIIFTALFTLSMTTFAMADDISIEIMGQRLDTDTPPLIIEGRTMAPVRAIFEGVGANVEWDADTKTITGAMLNKTVVMTVDSTVISINGEDSVMESSPVIIEGRTYAPARYVAESFGFEVKWDSENRVVSVTKPDLDETSAESTTELTTETTTQTTTETTTQPYDKYSTVYKGSDMFADRDLPKGYYVVMPDNGRLGYVYQYDYGATDSTDGKRFIYNCNAEYNDIVRVKENQYISISNGALVPSELVEKRDVARNGTFRIGTDISPGHYTFRLDPACGSGYVEVKSLDDNGTTQNYKLNSDYTEITLKLNKGMFLKKYGVDIYDSSLRMYADYSPAVTVNSALDDKYSFSDVRDAFKTKVLNELSDEIKSYTAESRSSSRYLKTNVDKKIASWKSSGTNDAEKRYADIAGEIYYRFYYFAYYSHPELSKYSTVIVYNNTYSGSQYKKYIMYDRDEYIRFVRELSMAESFDQCETAKYNAQCFYYNVPRGQGYGRN